MVGMPSIWDDFVRGPRDKYPEAQEVYERLFGKAKRSAKRKKKQKKEKKKK